MGKMVEILAQKQAEHFGVICNETRRADARWWLNAIATELVQEGPYMYETTVQRLRAAALDNPAGIG